MKILAVTSFNAAGRDLYGDRMMASFNNLWPWEIKLLVYAEGFNVPGTFSPRVENRMLPAWVEEFKDRNWPNARKRGFVRGLGNGAYDFRFDAIKF